MRELFKKHLVPILIFVALGLVVFLPILESVNTKILGNIPPNARDGLQFTWNFWWAKKTCLGFCGDFWYTDYQFFPTGTSLLFHNFSLSNIIPLLPFMYLGLSPVAAYNISLMLAIMLSSIGTYFLVFHLTRNGHTSFISGLIYGISPFVIGHILDGQLDLVAVQFFPFLFLFLIKSKEEKGNKYSVLSSITLFIIALTSPTFMIFIPFILGLWLIYRLITDSRNYKEVFKKILITLIVFLIPFLIFFYRNIKEANSFNISGPTKWDSEYNSSDIWAFITPTDTSLLGKKFFDTRYRDYKGTYSDKSVYLGISILVLSGLGIWAQRKKWKEILFWLSLGLLSFVFSLGPKLHINGRVILQWMPFQAMEKLPIFNMLRAPSRFSVIMFLSLSVLTGYGVFYILQRLKNNRLKFIVTTIIALLIIFEYFPFYKQVRTLSIPKGYEKIKEDKEYFAIIEAPLFWMTGLENKKPSSPEYLYYQTFHEKKIAGGYITRVKNETWESYRSMPLLNFVMSEQTKKLSPNKEAIETLEKYTVLNPKEILADNKFKYLIFNKKSSPELNNKIKNVLKDYLDLYFEDEELEIYAFKNYEKN